MEKKLMVFYDTFQFGASEMTHVTSESERTVAENVRIRRAWLHLSQAQLAQAAGISQSYVTKIESGSSNITLDILDRLAKALNVSPSGLVTPLDFESSTGKAA